MKNDTQFTPVCGCTDAVKAMTNRVGETQCSSCLERIQEIRANDNFKTIKANFVEGVIGFTAAEYKKLRTQHGLDQKVSESDTSG